MTISKPIEKAPTVKEDLLVASETAAEEAQLELDHLLQQFEKWSENNTLFAEIPIIIISSYFISI